MGALSVEFNHFLDLERRAAKRTGRQLRLSDLIGFFFLSGGFEIKGDFRIPYLYQHEPCDFGFLNEFLLTTYSWEIPFVYLSGSTVEVLNIPNVEFWMDFKATVEGTGDWQRLQTRSMDRIEAESVMAHAAKSAFVCLLERLDIDHPPGALDTLFKFINLPSLMWILVDSITEFNKDGESLHRFDTSGDYEWDDFLYLLGQYSGLRGLCITSTSQIDELMDIYRDYGGEFSGFAFDQHGILRSRECRGWSEYVQFRAKYSGPSRPIGRTFH
jgi:hypothetical protein